MDKSTYLPELINKAEEGDIDSIISIALLYEIGVKDFKKNIKAAFRYWMYAANEGHLWAQINVAKAYLHGIGVKKNREEALKWINLIAKDGFLSGGRERQSIIKNELICLEKISQSSLDGSVDLKFKKTILIVEPDAIIRRLISKILEDLGYIVYLAKDIDECIELILYSDITINLIISELMINNKDSLEMIAQIRKKSKYLDTPVMMISPEPTQDFVEKGKNLGIKEWIIRPLKENRFRALVKKILEEN